MARAEWAKVEPQRMVGRPTLRSSREEAPRRALLPSCCPGQWMENPWNPGTCLCLWRSASQCVWLCSPAFSGHVSLQLHLYLCHPPGDSSSSTLCPERGRGRASQHKLASELARISSLTGSEVRRRTSLLHSLGPACSGTRWKKPTGTRI